jgi:hypothetical protein
MLINIYIITCHLEISFDGRLMTYALRQRFISVVLHLHKPLENDIHLGELEFLQNSLIK